MKTTLQWEAESALRDVREFAEYNQVPGTATLAEVKAAVQSALAVAPPLDNMVTVSEGTFTDRNYLLGRVQKCIDAYGEHAPLSSLPNS